MTKLEYIKSCDIKELASLLCVISDAEGGCSNCIAAEHCYHKHNGFLDWLASDADE